MVSDTTLCRTIALNYYGVEPRIEPVPSLKHTAVVDWESAWAGNAAVDLALTHAYLDFYGPLELIRSFFLGYTTSLCPLPPEYDRGYLPVRMAQTLGLMWFWRQQRQATNLQRAVELYRAYCGLLK